MTNNTSDKTPLNLPAPYVNQFQTLVAGSNIRVAFGESGPEGQRAYRSAVVMATGDALELVDQLLAAIKTINPPVEGGLFGQKPQGIGLINSTPSPPTLGGILSRYGKPDV